MKIKLDSDDHFPLQKKLKLCKMIKVVRAVFHKSKNYPQVFLAKCLWKV